MPSASRDFNFHLCNLWLIQSIAKTRDVVSVAEGFACY